MLGIRRFFYSRPPDRVFWYRLLPEGPQRARVLTTLMVLPQAKEMPDYPKRLESEIEMLKTFHTEDMEVCEAVQKGMNSATFRSGRLSHLEKPIWHIQRYLARKNPRGCGDAAIGVDRSDALRAGVPGQ